MRQRYGIFTENVLPEASSSVDAIRSGTGTYTRRARNPSRNRFITDRRFASWSARRRIAMRNGRICLGYRALLLQQTDGEKASILFRFRKDHGAYSFPTDLLLCFDQQSDHYTCKRLELPPCLVFKKVLGNVIVVVRRTWLQAQEFIPPRPLPSESIEQFRVRGHAGNTSVVSVSQPLGKDFVYFGLFVSGGVTIPEQFCGVQLQGVGQAEDGRRRYRLSCLRTLARANIET